MTEPIEGIQIVDLTKVDRTDDRIIAITDGARGNAAHDGDLPTEAMMVINEAVREAWRTVEAGDEITEETVAADIAQRLHDVYGVTATARTPDVTPVQVYRTDDDREAVLVYEGGTQTGMRLLRQGAAIRIAYLNPDGTEPAPADAEYAWYDGPLTLGRTI